MKSEDYVTSILEAVKLREKLSTCTFDVIISTEDSSYVDIFKRKFELHLKQKKHLKEPSLHYIAFRPVGDQSHWTSAVLYIRAHKPRLFILDSLLNFAENVGHQLSDFMAAFNGHTYLCKSGVQNDDDNCANFTIDFLIQMAKMNVLLFQCLVHVRQNAPQATPGCKSKLTMVDIKALPWILVRNAQSSQLIKAYIAANPEPKSSQALQNYMKTHLVKKPIKGQIKEVNDGINELAKYYQSLIP